MLADQIFYYAMFFFVIPYILNFPE